MNRNKKRLIRTLVCLAFFIPALTLRLIFDDELPEYVWAAVFGAIYLGAGYDDLYRAAKNISKGRVFDENFLMCIASLGAFALGLFTEGEYPEAVAVMIFYQIGETFQSYAVGKSRKSIAALMDIRPDYARVIKDGKEETVDPAELSVGDMFVVRAGEKIPLDGTVVGGKSNIDVSAMTGESAPYFAEEGKAVISGTIVEDGAITVRADREFYDSTVSKILDLVENSAEKKAKTENFISAFSKYYTPIVVFSALALAVLPTLFCGIFLSDFSVWNIWIRRALAFLVVSCPCAIVISVPLGFFGGLGGAGAKGILIKGANSIERLKNANVFVFDKTGTLTEGKFGVAGVYPEEKRERLLSLAAVCEKNSNHPIAKGILNEYGGEIPSGYEIREVAGRGIVAVKAGETVLCGNEEFMRENGVEVTEKKEGYTSVFVAVNGVFEGVVLLADKIRADAYELIGKLKKDGNKVYMLTGDNEAAAKRVADELGIENWSGGLLPADKTEKLTEIISRKNKKDVVVFVGDGINDAPVIMLADVGVSMGGIGSDSAIEAADVVLMRDKPSAVIEAKKTAVKTMRIVRENIIFALAVKFTVLVFSMLGFFEAFMMWYAVFADVGVAVLAILNAMRALKI